MKKILRILAVLAIVIMMIPTTSVFAIANPTSIVTSSVVVFTNVLGTGDQVVFVRYDVNYAVDPTENANTTYMMAIYAVDGTTLLYTRPLTYYQHNITSIYLTSAQALVAGGAYTVRIMGNPAVFDPLVENTNMDSWVLTGSDYQDGTLMGDFLLGQAAILEADWVITLLTASNKLNATGGLTFKTAIPGLNEMTPEIFSTTSVTPGLSNNSFNNSYGNTAAARIGTMNVAFADIGAWLGISQLWAQVMVCGIGSFVLAGVMFAATRKPEMGVVGAGISLVAFGWMGWFPLQVLMIGLAVIAIFFGIIFIMARIG